MIFADKCPNFMSTYCVKQALWILRRILDSSIGNSSCKSQTMTIFLTECVFGLDLGSCPQTARDQHIQNNQNNILSIDINFQWHGGKVFGLHKNTQNMYPYLLLVTKQDVHGNVIEFFKNNNVTRYPTFGSSPSPCFTLWFVMLCNM